LRCRSARRAALRFALSESWSGDFFMVPHQQWVAEHHLVILPRVIRTLLRCSSVLRERCL
jgi:hypothetical protein